MSVHVHDLIDHVRPSLDKKEIAFIKYLRNFLQILKLLFVKGLLDDLPHCCQRQFFFASFYEAVESNQMSTLITSIYRSSAKCLSSQIDSTVQYVSEAIRKSQCFESIFHTLPHVII